MKYTFTILLLLITFTASHSQTWQNSLNGRNVWSLAKNGNVIYAGGLTGANSRIWKSTTDGATWDTIYAGSGATMWGFAFDSLGSMYVANFSSGMLKSTNGGANFTVKDVSFFGGKSPQGVACGRNGYIYATTSTGFFRSTDFGETYTETALTGLNCLPVLVDKDSSNIVYVGVTSAGGTGIGFYRSTDNGLTFSANLNPGKNGYNIFQKSDGSLYMITTTAPYNVDKSTNKGLTWVTRGNALNSPRGITIDNAGRIYLAGNGGIFRSSNDGQTFENANFTSSTTPIISSGPKLIAGVSGTNSGIWSAFDPGTSVTPLSGAVPENFSLSQNYPNPFNPETSISYAISVKANVKITIYNSLGREVNTPVNEVLSAGNYSIKFNGEGFSSGVYYYTIEAGEFKETKKMILIK
jgi:photosystem II stability/assembly factor-like uncharacterized protein